MSPLVRKLAAILGVCLVFVLGAVAGSAVTLRVVRHRVESLRTHQGSKLATEKLARYLSSRLRCDAAQSEQILENLRSAHDELWQVRRDVTPRVRDIFQRAVDRIRGVLRPDQAGVFDDLLAKQIARLHLEDDDPLTPNPPAK